MDKKENIFSDAYVTNAGTQSEPETKAETSEGPSIDINKYYGVGKPYRIITRGKVLDDKSR